MSASFENPTDCNPPGSSVHGISQARILEWDAISSSNLGMEPTSPELAGNDNPLQYSRWKNPTEETSEL